MASQAFRGVSYWQLFEAEYFFVVILFSGWRKGNQKLHLLIEKENCCDLEKYMVGGMLIESDLGLESLYIFKF